MSYCAGVSRFFHSALLRTSFSMRSAAMACPGTAKRVNSGVDALAAASLMNVRLSMIAASFKSVHAGLLVDIQGRKQPSQVGDLRQVVDDDVGLVRMQVQIMLVVGLGVVEPLQGHDLGDDAAGEHASRLQLGDVVVGYPLLVRAGIEDRR